MESQEATLSQRGHQIAEAELSWEQRERNMRLIYIHEFFLGFADSIMRIALPIFIYQLFGSVRAVFLWSMAWNIVFGLSFIPVFNLAMKLRSPKLFMIIGIMLYTLGMWLLSSTTSPDLARVACINVVFALYITFFWPIRHWFFSVNSDYRKIGSQVSLMKLIRIFVKFVGPVLTGIIAYYGSLGSTLYLAAIGIFFSVIPILFFETPVHETRYTKKDLLEILEMSELKAVRAAYFFEGFLHYLVSVSWVLAFAIFIGNVLELGMLVGITTVIAALLTWGSGKLFDSEKRSELLTRLTKLRVAGGLMYASVFLFPSLIYVSIVDMFNRLLGDTHETVVDSYLFAYSSKVHPVHFHFNRELHLTLARIICCSGLSIMFYYSEPVLLWLNIALGSFMFYGWLGIQRAEYLLAKQ